MSVSSRRTLGLPQIPRQARPVDTVTDPGLPWSTHVEHVLIAAMVGALDEDEEFIAGHGVELHLTAVRDGDLAHPGDLITIHDDGGEDNSLAVHVEVHGAVDCETRLLDQSRALVRAVSDPEGKVDLVHRLNPRELKFLRAEVLHLGTRRLVAMTPPIQVVPAESA